ncbi:helix-turn-helix domain-containing protein [Candidatus Poriferisodalis sp.]|uniref:helix-turn-helix domain-containing protein n=1 Tax=Candidatus Poriferisodalis sp. TaxID=3101277 RepID=UPI003B014561
MDRLDTLFGSDLEDAAQAAAREVPDVVAALDFLMPMLGDYANPAILRRYRSNVESAASALVEMQARYSEFAMSPAVAYALISPVFVQLPWIAPSVDGIGAITVLVDRVRGLAGGLPHQCVRARDDIDEHYLAWFSKAMGDIEFERNSATPLRRAMATLDLSSGAFAELMGVTRQAVDKWLVSGPPSQRLPKIATIVEIADILRYRLREGMPSIVARRSAPAYEDRTMLELIAADEHEWLLRDIEKMFDYSTTA